MRFSDEMKKAPLELFSAASLVAVGVYLGFQKSQATIIIGSVASAIGGALLSFAVNKFNCREKAAEFLKPELQSMARHLADTASKLSRAIQEYKQEDVAAGLTIDRISQLISSIYSSLNDMHIVAGVTTSYEALVETVRECESMATRLGELTHLQAPVSQEIEDLRGHLAIARTQFDTSRKKLGDLSTIQRDEQVTCPHCNHEASVLLGTRQGDSGAGFCSSCGQKFHVHRAADGRPFTRKVGMPSGSPPFKIINICCPTCKSVFSIKFYEADIEEIHFCLKCCNKLTVAPTGNVTSAIIETPKEASTVGFSGNKQVLVCPSCRTSINALWAEAESVRGTCKRCSIILQAARQERPLH